MLGNTNGKANGVIGLLPLTTGLYAGRAHHGQPTGHAIQEKPNVLKNIGSAWLLRFWGEKGADVLLCSGDGKLMSDHIVGRRLQTVVAFQPQQGTGVAFGHACVA